MKDERVRLSDLLLILLVLLKLGLILLGLLLFYPFWLVFSSVVSRVGINGIRNIAGKLETPVVFYEHQQTRRRAVFMATIHIAEAKYFTALQEIIDSLHGYKVLFEGIGKLSQQEESSLTYKEHLIADQFRCFFDLRRKLK